MLSKAAIIATADGRKPTAPQKGEKNIAEALEVCRKGWPDEKWKVFDIEFTKAPKKEWGSVSEINLKHMPESELKKTLATSLKTRFQETYKVEV